MVEEVCFLKKGEHSPKLLSRNEYLIPTGKILAIEKAGS